MQARSLVGGAITAVFKEVLRIGSKVAVVTKRFAAVPRRVSSVSMYDGVADKYHLEHLFGGLTSLRHLGYSCLSMQAKYCSGK